MTESKIVTVALQRAAVRAAESKIAADQCDGNVRAAFADVAVVLDRLAAALPALTAEESKS